MHPYWNSTLGRHIRHVSKPRDRHSSVGLWARAILAAAAIFVMGVVVGVGIGR